MQERRTFLSINVGFINLLPLPAFDGGHIVFLIIEMIKGSPVKPELEEKIHGIGMMLLLLLMVVITINDSKVIDFVDNYEGAITAPGYFGTVSPGSEVVLGTR